MGAYWDSKMASFIKQTLMGLYDDFNKGGRAIQEARDILCKFFEEHYYYEEVEDFKNEATKAFNQVLEDLKSEPCDNPKRLDAVVQKFSELLNEIDLDSEFVR